jgi:hypothetical protein
MRSVEESAFSRPRLERIWLADILPLLQEHYYGQWEHRAAQFELESLLKVVAPAPADEDLDRKLLAADGMHSQPTPSSQ